MPPIAAKEGKGKTLSVLLRADAAELVRLAAFLRGESIQGYAEGVVRRAVPADLLASRDAAEHLVGLATSTCPSTPTS